MENANANGNGIKLSEIEGLTLALAREKQQTMWNQAAQLEQQAKQLRDNGQAIINNAAQAVLRSAGIQAPPNSSMQIVNDDKGMPAFLAWTAAAAPAAPAPTPTPPVPEPEKKEPEAPVAVPAVPAAAAPVVPGAKRDVIPVPLPPQQ